MTESSGDATRPSPTKGDRAQGVTSHLRGGTGAEGQRGDPGRDTQAQAEHRMPAPGLWEADRDSEGAALLRSQAGQLDTELFCRDSKGKARCSTSREKQPSAECWARGAEAQSDFPSFAISSSQILVSSSISWFWKESTSWGPQNLLAQVGDNTWPHLPSSMRGKGQPAPTPAPGELLCQSRHRVEPCARPSSSQSDLGAAEICTNPAPAHSSANRHT